MAINDIYRLTLDISHPAKECSAVFTYRMNNPVSGVAMRLLEAFEEDLLAYFTNVMPYGVNITGAHSVCLATPSDYADITFGSEGNGTRTDDPVPELCAPWICLRYKSNRAGPGTRSGQKRFPFLNENDVQVAELDITFYSAPIVEGLGDAMAQTIAFASITFTPVVVEHPLELGEQPALRYVVTSYAPQLKLSSQVSRK